MFRTTEIQEMPETEQFITTMKTGAARAGSEIINSDTGQTFSWISTAGSRD